VRLLPVPIKHKTNDQEAYPMKLQKMLFMFSVVFLLVSSAVAVAAGDFDWIRDFSIRAEADPSEFRARLAARFKIGDAQIDAVLSNVERPEDAYMVFRLGEMSTKPTDYVIEKYRSEKGKGWGALAKSLGIKPGSKEFHALKRGNDIYDDNDKGKGKSKDKGKGKGRN
jgi:hypothetical protein